MLNIARVEYSYNHFIDTGRGKNALKLLAYLHKAISFLYSELELLHLKIQYPEQFQQSDQLLLSLSTKKLEV